jgi:hypothetical protein
MVGNMGVWTTLKWIIILYIVALVSIYIPYIGDLIIIVAFVLLHILGAIFILQLIAYPWRFYWFRVLFLWAVTFLLAIICPLLGLIFGIGTSIYLMSIRQKRKSK